MSTDIEFRCCERADYPACGRIGAAAFAWDAGAFDRKLNGVPVKIYEEAANAIYAGSTYRELAIVDDEIVGFIFGRIDRHFTLINRCCSVKRYLVLLGPFLLGRLGHWRKLVKLLGPFLREEQKVRRNVPPSEGEVLYFAVSQEYQGRGVGRKLMDRFVQHAARCGVQTLSVGTSEIDNFQFYERYGFRKRAEFDSPLGLYLHDRLIKGFIYQLPLHEDHVPS